MRAKIKKWIIKNNHNDLSGKTILITGANSGIGFEVAKQCAYLNMNIIMAVRNKQKAIDAKESIIKKYPNANISIMIIDLSSIEVIKEFVYELTSKKIDIDIFYNNAGVYRIPNSKTLDGFELVMGTNYIGTYALNNLIVPYLLSLPHEVKLIFTTSITAKYGKINYNDFFMENHYKSMQAYANSKQAINKLFVHLSSELKNSNIKVYLTHPGVTYTPLIFKAYKKWFAKLANFAMNLVLNHSDLAALSTLYLLFNDFPTQTFTGPKGIFNVSGYPCINKIYKNSYSNVTELMEYTYQITNINYYTSKEKDYVVNQ